MIEAGSASNRSVPNSPSPALSAVVGRGCATVVLAGTDGVSLKPTVARTAV